MGQGREGSDGHVERNCPDDILVNSSPVPCRLTEVNGDRSPQDRCSRYDSTRSRVECLAFVPITDYEDLLTTKCIEKRDSDSLFH